MLRWASARLGPSVVPSMLRLVDPGARRSSTRRTSHAPHVLRTAPDPRSAIPEGGSVSDALGVRVPGDLDAELFRLRPRVQVMDGGELLRNEGIQRQLSVLGNPEVQRLDCHLQEVRN